MKTVSSINEEEVKKFERLADEWWDGDGKFKPLHMLNPCRLEFIVDHLSLHFKKDMTNSEMPLKGIKVLDNQTIGEKRNISLVKDYDVSNVSLKIERILISYVDYVNRVVWKKES